METTNTTIESGVATGTELKVVRGNSFSIPPSMIVIENENVRDSYPEEKFQVLKQSIKENGVLDPIHVRKLRGEEKYALTHGFNRMRAVWELVDEGFEIINVKAIISTLSAEEELIRHITLNSGEPLSKYEISKILVQLKAFGWKNKDISKKLGYTEQEISNLITFQTNASQEVKNAVKEGLIDINPAIMMVRESGTTQQQNVVLNIAKEKAIKENKTKIGSKDILSKKLTLQDKLSKVVEIIQENNGLFETKSGKLIEQLFYQLNSKESTPETIIKQLFF